MIDVKFKITQERAEYMGRIISYDLSLYLSEYNKWYKENMPNLVGFYTGRLKEISVDNFLNLENLLVKSAQITNNITINKHLFVTLLDWEIVEFLENIKANLWAMNRLDKFLRSTQTNANQTNQFEFNQTLTQNQTLEHVSFDTIQSQDYNNDWVDVALRNDLAEVDYTNEGGNALILSVNLNTRSVRISGVLDNIQGNKVYGLDLQKKLEFVDDDLKTLGYAATIYQAVDILMNIMKGDVPEFLEMGRSGGVGANLRNFAINTVIRELVQTFSSDDTLTNFNVNKLRYDDAGNYFVEFSVSSRLDLIVNNQITV